MVLDKVGLEHIHNSTILGSLKGIKGEMVELRDVREALTGVDKVNSLGGGHDGTLTSSALEIYDQMKKLHEGVKLKEYIRSFDEAIKTYQLETMQIIP
jgi:hypothetical protein